MDSSPNAARNHKYSKEKELQLESGDDDFEERLSLITDNLSYHGFVESKIADFLVTVKQFRTYLMQC